MNFPVWEVPVIGGGMLIGIVSVFHVFISQFAVGGGLFLVLTEMKAYRENSQEILDYVRRHSRFFALLTLVLGVVSGVAIWFTIALVHPSATSSLINTFMWAWAIEWIIFFVEIASIIIYVATWNRMSRKDHVRIGWIYAVSGFLTLAVINGILTYMLTPGAWLETKNFWDGIFNPTYLPAFFSRALVCVSFAGIYAFLTATRVRDEVARTTILRYSAKWVLPSLALLPISMYWYYTTIPESAKEIVAGGIEYIHTTAAYGIIAALLVLVFVVVGPLWRPARFNFAQAVIILLLTAGSMFAAERVREAIRKPYVLYGYMYSNSVLVEDFDRIQQSGILSSAKWVSEKEITPENEMKVGQELFRVSCSSCHTVGGYQDIVKYTAPFDEELLELALTDLTTLRGYMPPFAGNEQERKALAKWLISLQKTSELTAKGVE